MIKLTLGATFPLGSSTIALSANSSLLIPLPEGTGDYELRISADAERLIKVLKSGIKIVSKEPVGLEIIVDDSFREIRVVLLTNKRFEALIRNSGPSTYQESFGSVLNRLSEDGELIKVILTLVEQLESIYPAMVEVIASCDTDLLIEEINSFVGESLIELPTDEPELSN